MAVVPGIIVQWNLSPRIITVPDPLVEITIQDLHDTLRDLEQEQTELIYGSIISSAGKEELGGGVTVGITATLLNARLSFQSRKVFAQTGTVTTADATGRVLVDSAATFIANGVIPGSWILNLTDGSIASVLTVDSETQLTTDILGGGTDDQFDSADAYKVMVVVQGNVSGGNLVAVEADGVTELDPILPTAGTQVVRTSSSSATLQSQSTLQYASFGGGVHIDVTSPYSGMDFPVGTGEQPVNNVLDALLIAVANGFTTFFIVGDITFTTGHDVSGFLIIGQNAARTVVTIDPGANVLLCEIREAKVTGTLDGGTVIRQGTIETLNVIDGFIFETMLLAGTITLNGTPGTTAHFLNCFSGVPGSGTPLVDMAGDGAGLALRGYNGGIELHNKTGAAAVTVDLSSGQVVLAATVTAGEIVVRGVGELTDNSVGASVDATGLIQGDMIIRIEQILRNKLVMNPTLNQLEIYDDVGTLLFITPVWADAAGTVPWTSGAVAARDRLEPPP